MELDTNVPVPASGSSRSASNPPPTASASTIPSVSAGLLAAALASPSNRSLMVILPSG